jgi:hypothetical protein
VIVMSQLEGQAGCSHRLGSATRVGSGPDSAGWDSGLSSIIAAYASPLPYYLLSGDPDVLTFPTALSLVEHLRRRYHKGPVSKQRRAAAVGRRARAGGGLRC